LKQLWKPSENNVVLCVIFCRCYLNSNKANKWKETRKVE